MHFVNVREKVREAGATLFIEELENEGYCLPGIKALFASNKLDELHLEKSVLHELGHVVEHGDNYGLYHATPAMHYAMEYQAGCFEVRERVLAYLETYDIPKESVNYFEIMRQLDIHERFESVVQESLEEFYC